MSKSSNRNLLAVNNSTGLKKVITTLNGSNNRKKITNALLRELGEEKVSKNAFAFVETVNSIENGQNVYGTLGFDFITKPIKSRTNKKTVKPLDITENMTKVTLPECINAANNCTTLDEFKNMCPSMYTIAEKNGWINSVIIFSGGTVTHVEKANKDNKPKGYWSVYENCKKAAGECYTRAEFSNRFPRAYQESLKNEWIDDFLPLQRRGNRRKWTVENIMAEAAKYSSPYEFRTKSKGAYCAASRFRLLDTVEYKGENNKVDITPEPINPTQVNTNDITPEPVKRKYTMWTEETVRELASKFTSRTEFSKAYHGAERYATRHGFIGELFTLRNAKVTEDPVVETVSNNNTFFGRVINAFNTLFGR